MTCLADEFTEDDIQTISSADSFGKELSRLVRKNKKISAGAQGASDQFFFARLIVKAKKGSLSFQSLHPTEVLRDRSRKLYIVQFKTAKEARTAYRKLKKNTKVKYVEPDAYIGAYENKAGLNNSTAWNSSAKTAEKEFYSWGVDVTNTTAFAKYVKEKGTGSVTVGVVDTGVSQHPLLKKRLVQGIDYVEGDDDPNDETGHGTHVAGIIADCTPGLPVKILPVRVLDDMEGANCSIIGEGIRYAADHGCDVINLSLGGEKNQYIDECVKYALNKKCVVVAASGNGYGNTKEYSPQHLDDIIVVGAVDQNDRRCFSSNVGQSVDVVAPGEQILGASMTGGYIYKSGTSMAAPHVAAEAAMLRLLYPSKSSGQIQKMIRKNTIDLGDPGWDRFYGAGRVVLKVPSGKKTETINPVSVNILAYDNEIMYTGTTIYLSAIINPLNATDKTLTWVSNKKNVAAVEDGVVTFKKPGKVTITAKTSNGKKASLEYKVVNPAKHKLPKGTIVVPYSSMAVTKIHADKVSVPVELGKNLLCIYSGIVHFTAQETRKYTFTVSDIIRPNKTGTKEDIIGGGFWLTSYDLGYMKLLTARTEGGKATSFRICTKDFEGDKYDDEDDEFDEDLPEVSVPVTVKTFLSSRSAVLKLKKGQNVYLFCALTEGGVYESAERLVSLTIK